MTKCSECEKMREFLKKRIEETKDKYGSDFVMGMNEGFREALQSCGKEMKNDHK